MVIPQDYDDTNEQFIDIVQANDWGFPVTVFEEVVDEKEDFFRGGFYVLPIPQEVLKLWFDLLETPDEDNGNFFTD
jgi:hypothetical protein